METKIQQLTDKLYQEGVEKGEIEAARLIEEGQNKRKALIEEAQKEAKEIVEKATKNANDLKKNTESELRLYSTQSVEALKSEISNVITDKLATTAVKGAFDEKDFMQKVILTLVAAFPNNESLTISTSDAAALTDYFKSNMKDLLDKGLKIEEVNGKKHSFSIAPADGSYKINFGEEEFIEYFKDFLRPQLVNLLF